MCRDAPNNYAHVIVGSFDSGVAKVVLNQAKVAQRCVPWLLK